MARPRAGVTDGPGDNAVDPGITYLIHRQQMAVAGRSWVETDTGRRAFQIYCASDVIPRTLVLRGLDGRELYRLREQAIRIRDTLEIEDDGGTAATVRRDLLPPLRERFAVDLPGAGEWTAQGNILDHEYRITGRSGRVADVSRKWVPDEDRYGIRVAHRQDDALAMMVAMAIDQIAAPSR